ncbi:DUF5009 domain-containing protein [Rhabdobacter roseus]|uniref:Putative acyltransferase n=1 Tax=Rhabdobacter roseus TaxID=1655419 RepID=A0A840TH99_9BACT|nr:DUF5009 domain-containing protein [Rhabdobacter roseus]MBB5282335.1 putative acyltransferase [Rhabdobacter roseus]
MPEASTPTRLLSLDTLRGFDMFWITGGEDILHVLAKATGWGGAVFLAEQFTHVRWDGFRAYDLIFPLFLFLAGVSTPFSLGARLERGTSRRELLPKVVRRGLVLVALGILYNNGLFHTAWENMRYPSVLGRIGLAGMFAQIIYLYASRRGQWVWFGGILVGYWLLMTLVPVPGCGAGLLTMECNPASYLDRLLLPGRLHKGIHDPEGVLSTLPAIATGLMGTFAGNVLRTNEQALSKRHKALYLVAAGVVALLSAQLWNFVFPINKQLWTSSFTLFAGGWSLLLLALFYGIIDILRWHHWTFFFLVIGTNSIVIYLVGKFIDFEYTAEAIFGGLLGFLAEPARAVGAVVIYVLVQWSFMYLLYRNKLFLRI